MNNKATFFLPMIMVLLTGCSGDDPNGAFFLTGTVQVTLTPISGDDLAPSGSATLQSAGDDSLFVNDLGLGSTGWSCDYSEDGGAEYGIGRFDYGSNGGIVVASDLQFCFLGSPDSYGIYLPTDVDELRMSINFKDIDLQAGSATLGDFYFQPSLNDESVGLSGYADEEQGSVTLPDYRSGTAVLPAVSFTAQQGVIDDDKHVDFATSDLEIVWSFDDIDGASDALGL